MATATIEYTQIDQDQCVALHGLDWKGYSTQEESLRSESNNIGLETVTLIRDRAALVFAG